MLTFRYDVAARTYDTLKVTPVPEYDPSLYETSRLEVTARDGEKVPVTLLWRPDALGSGDTPTGGADVAGGGASGPSVAAPCHLCA